MKQEDKDKDTEKEKEIPPAVAVTERIIYNAICSCLFHMSATRQEHLYAAIVDHFAFSKTCHPDYKAS